MHREEYCRPFDLTQSIPPGLSESLVDSGQLHIEDLVVDNEVDAFDNVIQRIHTTLDTQQCVHLFILRVILSSHPVPQRQDMHANSHPSMCKPTVGKRNSRGGFIGI